MPTTLDSCGVCSCTANEVDKLIQLGEMGRICLSCLEEAALTALPLIMFGNSVPASANQGTAGNNIVPFPRRGD